MENSVRAQSYLLLTAALTPSVVLYAFAAYHIPLNTQGSINTYEKGRWLFSLLIIFGEIIWLICHGLLQGRIPTKAGFQTGLTLNAPLIAAIIAVIASSEHASPLTPRILATVLVYASISCCWASLFRTSKSQLAVASAALVMQFAIDMVFTLLFYGFRM